MSMTCIADFPIEQSLGGGCWDLLSAWTRPAANGYSDNTEKELKKSKEAENDEGIAVLDSMLQKGLSQKVPSELSEGQATDVSGARELRTE